LTKHEKKELVTVCDRFETLKHSTVTPKLSQLERKIEKHDTEIQTIFEAIRQLMVVSEKPKRKIGFHQK